MNLTNFIKSKLLNKFSEWGFEYEKDGPLWLFIRETKGIKETIQIDKGKWEQKGLRLTYYKERQSVSSTMLTACSFTEEYYYYSDEESLCNLLDKFIRITENYALDWFESIKPISQFPQENYYQESWKSKTENFMNENRLIFSENSIKKLDEILGNNHNKDFFFYASRFIGDYIVSEFFSRMGIRS
ncbi:hypothetical protein ACE3MZ_13640 [Paenibacillus sp. WLX1005]|uniref:hypothetical protein n=1 Tax=Paenibacillus sp. WLX1005 TaxID=3243766 RepID=UPI0039843C39